MKNNKLFISFKATKFQSLILKCQNTLCAIENYFKTFNSRQKDNPSWSYAFFSGKLLVEDRCQ